MKTNNLLVIPLAFAAGIVSIVLLERFGLVQFNRASQANSPELTEPGLEERTGDNIAEVVNSDVTQNQSQGNAVESHVNAILSSEQLSERMDQLQQQLRSATVESDLMQAKINTLEQKLETINSGAEFLPNGQSANTLPGESSEPSEQAGSNRRFGFGSPDNDVQFNSLVSAGVDPLVAEQIKQRSDQWTLRRLELIDQATREGWRRSDQFDEQLTALQEERPNIRDELGDNDFDRYLYESGDSNRVQIASIIDGSAAQIAGMQDGDVVVSYANQRVFTLRELQQATSGGSRGEPVQLDVIRGGETIVIELPRGPMGVTLSGVRVEP